jgi:hypothetical protein
MFWMKIDVCREQRRHIIEQHDINHKGDVRANFHRLISVGKFVLREGGKSECNERRDKHIQIKNIKYLLK